jgi:acetyl esterase/lipase
MKKNRVQNLMVLLPLILLIPIKAWNQEVRIALYNGAIPNSKASTVKEFSEKKEIFILRNVKEPDIAIYLPTKQSATGQCIVICPGGGYWQLSYDLEGTDIARYFNSIGIAAGVLKYRLPSKEYCIDPNKAPLLDAQRAIRLVRHHASKWNIHPDKIGIMGFSAGGHLASTLGTHFDFGNPTAKDSVEKQSCRPDFMILIYPVISLSDSVTHLGSRRMLLGDNPTEALVLNYSNELHVRAGTPPTFLMHADNDSAVSVENSLLFYKALRKKNIPAELHIVSEGDHGFGLSPANDHVAAWTNQLKLWLKSFNQSP